MLTLLYHFQELFFMIKSVNIINFNILTFAEYCCFRKRRIFLYDVEVVNTELQTTSSHRSASCYQGFLLLHMHV